MSNRSKISALYRTATAEELAYYQQVMYPLQDRVFQTASVYGDNIYLTGGTTLARFYFEHRLSEDLDFFTPTNDLATISTDLMTRLQEQGFTVQSDKRDVYFARFFVVTDDCRLKIEIVKEFNLIGALIQTDKAIFINSLDDLGGNKISAYEDRAEIKDIIDLYYLARHFSLERLFELADQKRVPIAYEHLLTINAQGISGKALITKELPADDLLDFIEELKTRTEIEIKKKEILATEKLSETVAGLLWDFPREDRTINPYSIPVLKRRLNKLPLPQKRVLERTLTVAVS